MRVTVNAPAKLNLSLDIIGRRPDGYHLLKMVTQSIDLCDVVTVSTDADDDDVPIRLSCDKPLPEGDENTAERAARCFFEETGAEPAPITIRIKKRIPLAAGLGGGSADAAAVIVALDELFSTRLTCDEMCAIGAKVGSDVPACIVGGTALVEGTGSLINPLPDLPECYFVLVKAEDKLSTGDMYDRFDALGEETDIDTDAVVDAVCLGDLAEAGDCFNNAFEPLWDGTTVPKVRKLMLRCGALGASLTGSGPTVFSVFEERSDAYDCAALLKKDYDDVIVCQPIPDGAQID